MICIIEGRAAQFKIEYVFLLAAVQKAVQGFAQGLFLAEQGRALQVAQAFISGKADFSESVLVLIITKNTGGQRVRVGIGQQKGRGNQTCWLCFAHVLRARIRSLCSVVDPYLQLCAASD